MPKKKVEVTVIKKPWYRSTRYVYYTFCFILVVLCGLVVRSGIRLVEDAPPPASATCTLKFINARSGTMFFMPRMDTAWNVGDMVVMDSTGEISMVQNNYTQVTLIVIGKK